MPGSSIPPNTTASSTLILFTLGSLDQKKRSIHFLLDESDLMLGHKESIEGAVIASILSLAIRQYRRALIFSDASPENTKTNTEGLEVRATVHKTHIP